MIIDNIGDLIKELETFDEWQCISFGYKKGNPCLFIHDNIDYTLICGHIYIQRS